MGIVREDQKAKIYFKLQDNSAKELECSVKKVDKDRISLKCTKEILNYAEYLEEGSEFPVKIYTPAGIQSFETIVLNSPLESEFIIEYSPDHLEIQRREYLRVNYKTRFVVHTHEGNKIVETIDISGGGIRFFSKEDFYPEEEISFSINIPAADGPIKIKGEILKTDYLPEGHNVVMFKEIEKKDRDYIVKFCFQRHIDNIRNPETEIDES